LFNFHLYIKVKFVISLLLNKQRYSYTMITVNTYIIMKYDWRLVFVGICEGIVGNSIENKQN